MASGEHERNTNTSDKMATEAAAGHDDRKAAIAAHVDAMLHRADVPSCVIAVRDQKQVIWEHAYGSADDAPDTATTAFHLFSGTKVFTAIAVLKLVESGLLDLSTTAQSILQDRHVDPAVEQPYRDIIGKLTNVTVGQLLSHSSGLRDSPLSAIFNIQLSPQVNATQPDLSHVLAKFTVSKAPTTDPARPAHYANINYVILGEITSQIAGCSYEDYVKCEVLTPMGSGSEFSCAGAVQRGTMARGYINWWNKLALQYAIGRETMEGVFLGASELFSRAIPLNHFDLKLASVGGLVGTVRDFLPVFDEVDLTKSDTVLNSKSKEAMVGLQAVGACGVRSRKGMGYGWKHGVTSDNQPFINHEGCGGGFTTEMRYYPTSGVGMVVMMNKWSVTMGECVLAHELCEYIRSQVSALHNSER